MSIRLKIKRCPESNSLQNSIINSLKNFSGNKVVNRKFSRGFWKKVSDQSIRFCYNISNLLSASFFQNLSCPDFIEKYGEVKILITWIFQFVIRISRNAWNFYFITLLETRIKKSEKLTAKKLQNRALKFEKHTKCKNFFLNIFLLGFWPKICLTNLLFGQFKRGGPRFLCAENFFPRIKSVAPLLKLTK